MKKNTYRTLGNPSAAIPFVKAVSLLVGMLLCCLTTQAQKLTVESLEYVPNDAAAASYETQMQDINGNFAGVVKVHIALDDVQFEGGGVLKQEKRGLGEYWVWMAQGSNRLKVRAPGYLPLEVSFRAYEEVNIVKSKLTYKLVITVPNVEIVQKQKFTLRYTPTDATVIIDDQVVEGINGVYEDELLVGDHSYSIAKKGYGVDKGIFSLLSSNPKRLSVELEKLQETTVEDGKQTTWSGSPTKLPSEDAEIEGKTPEQIYDLGEQYLRGIGGKPQDDAKALQYYKIAAERGNTDAEVRIGDIYNAGWGVAQDDAKAMQYYKIAAERGNTDAEVRIGGMYSAGRGVAQDDAEAVRWYRKAAEQGNANGQFLLGVMYENGEGVTKDYSEAVKWYRKAAEQGNANGQCNLGVMYYNGNGVTQDYSEAVKWYRKAAEQEDAMAQYLLSICYKNGTGVAIDVKQSEYWHKKAISNGLE